MDHIIHSRMYFLMKNRCCPEVLGFRARRSCKDQAGVTQGICDASSHETQVTSRGIAKLPLEQRFALTDSQQPSLKLHSNLYEAHRYRIILVLTHCPMSYLYDHIDITFAPSKLLGLPPVRAFADCNSCSCSLKKQLSSGNNKVGSIFNNIATFINAWDRVLTYAALRVGTYPRERV